MPKCWTLILLLLVIVVVTVGGFEDVGLANAKQDDQVCCAEAPAPFQQMLKMNIG
jgi:hypothetical protein